MVIGRWQGKDKADHPNDANGQVGLGMGQLTAHGIHDHSAFFKADDNKSINGGRKGQDLGKGTDFAHDHGQVPSLGDARVKLKRGENQGQNDVTNRILYNMSSATFSMTSSIFAFFGGLVL